MKICLTCRMTKLFSAFYLNRSKPDGHHSNCKDCMKAYQKNSDQRNAKRTAQRKAIVNRQQLFAAARPEPQSRRNWESDDDAEQPVSDEKLLAPPPLEYSAEFWADVETRRITGCTSRRIDEPLRRGWNTW